jgi:hypothetical protein
MSTTIIPNNIHHGGIPWKLTLNVKTMTDTSPNASLILIQLNFLGICIYQNSYITASKELTAYVMGPVETLNINTIDVPHASEQVGIRAAGAGYE